VAGMDVIMLGIASAFLLVTLGLVRLCERLER
jgi:hypothetical protein